MFAFCETVSQHHDGTWRDGWTEMELDSQIYTMSLCLCTAESIVALRGADLERVGPGQVWFCTCVRGDPEEAQSPRVFGESLTGL